VLPVPRLLIGDERASPELPGRCVVTAAAHAVLCLLIIAGADCLTLAPAAFNARYRTPRRVAEALIIAAVVSVALISAAVLL
jgi:hypothetical protein